MESEQKSTLPLHLNNGRVDAAHDAVHQAMVLLDDATERLSGYDQEEDFVLRALVIRTRQLVSAASVLLGYEEEEGEDMVAEAMGEVHCG